MREERIIYNLNLKWLWYMALCVIMWLPLAFFSKLGTDILKKETILFSLEDKLPGLSLPLAGIEEMVKKGAITSTEGKKLNTESEISAAGIMNLLTVLGSIPVGLMILIFGHQQRPKEFKGIFYGLTTGVLGMIGFAAIFFAFAQGGGNGTLISVATGLFPIVTIALALLFLKERLTMRQAIGLVFAITAIIIFSIPESVL